MVSSLLLEAEVQATLKDVLSDNIVVHAHVVAVEGTDQYNTSTQRIDHVYCGILPQGMTEFKDWSQASCSVGDPVWPALKVGEEGIWLFRRLNDRERIGRPDFQTLGVEWPVRPNVESATSKP